MQSVWSANQGRLHVRPRLFATWPQDGVPRSPQFEFFYEALVILFFLTNLYA